MAVKQHYIPRFILKGFISDSLKGQRVWVYPKDRDTYPALLTEVGHQRYFYGKESPTDSYLQESENEHSLAVSEVRLGADPRLFTKQLGEVFYLLAIRTRTIRVDYTSISERLIDGISQSDNLEKMRAWILRNLDERFDNAIADLLGDMTEGQRLIFEARLNTDMMFKDQIKRNVRMQIQSGFSDKDILGIFCVLQRLKGTIPQHIAEGHTRGIARLFEEGYPNTWLGNALWSVVHDEHSMQILGDNAVLGIRADGESMHPMASWKDCIGVILPLASNRILVATQNKSVCIEDMIPGMSARVAACSREYFVADQKTGEYEKLRNNIGTTKLLDDTFLDNIYGDVLG